MAQAEGSEGLGFGVASGGPTSAKLEAKRRVPESHVAGEVAEAAQADEAAVRRPDDRVVAAATCPVHATV